MFEIEESEIILSREEKQRFEKHLNDIGLTSNIWEIFTSLFDSRLKNTYPLLIKVLENGNLEGCAILIKCSRYGRALFKNKMLSGLVNLVGIPVFLWIRFGCCMDMMSNIGFSSDPKKMDMVHKAIIDYLKKEKVLALITDYNQNINSYPSASVLPALPHALIDTSSMGTIDDYINEHKNLKKKLRKFESRGGEFRFIERRVTEEYKWSIDKCFQSTAEKSVFYLPYQELYLNAALNTSQRSIDQVYYFIIIMNGEFLGYQAAIKSGKYLNALHGAFDRTLSTTHHAYDILFIKMTEFAIKNNLDIVDFGAVLNETKQRMVNRTIPMSYYLYSKNRFMQRFFNSFLKLTNIQGSHQMKFRG